MISIKKSTLFVNIHFSNLENLILSHKTEFSKTGLPRQWNVVAKYVVKKHEIVHALAYCNFGKNTGNAGLQIDSGTLQSSFQIDTTGNDNVKISTYFPISNVPIGSTIFVRALCTTQGSVTIGTVFSNVEFEPV